MFDSSRSIHGGAPILLAALLAACTATPREGWFACDTDDDCPNGYTCNPADGRCYSTPPPEMDAGDTDEGNTDAGNTDAGDTDAGNTDAGPGDGGATDAGALCDGVDCSSLDGPCAMGVCDPSDGSCQTMTLTDGTACDDGDPCTVGDACGGGTCAGSAMDCSSLTDACHTGMCSPSTGSCAAVPVPDGSSCDDGDACTLGDVCTSGVCDGAPRSCNDGDACTADSCSASGACVHMAIPGCGSCTPTDIEAEDAGVVTRSASWSVASGSVLHAGQALETGAAGQTLDLTFTGTSLRVYSRRGPNTHGYSVSVDGNTPVSVTTTASSFSFQQEAVIVTGLSSGSHTAHLVCTNPICQIDYFRAGCD